MILHKLSLSPFSHMSLQHCLQRIHPTDGLLLTQDAIYALVDKTLHTQLIKLNSVYILKEDAEARGIQIKANNIRSITYAEFVQLSLDYDKVMSW